jgi:hypothetical protein
MDRTIVYPGSIPLDTDLLATNRNMMVGLGALLRTTLGTGTVCDGLAVSPSAPASMSVVVGPGSITAISVVDPAAFGTLPADAEPLVKMGINLVSTSFTLSAPGTAGQSIAWLVEAAFQEADVNATVLPYYNAANPVQPWMGPSNSGAAQPTSRVQRVQLQVRPGAAVPSGTQVPPPLDAGWVGIAVVTVSYGQAAIDASNIAPYPSAPLIAYRLPELRPGFASLQAFSSSGWFIVPSGVSRAKVTLIGGGGAGGMHAALPGGGGGAGGRAVRVLTGLIPGAAYFVTVGAGGQVWGWPAAGGAGGTSSFATLVSATGGAGGGGGVVAVPSAGGNGGSGVGGDINEAGAFGTDGVIEAGRGGDGGGPGGGRGATGSMPGVAAPGYGGGGGGGGCSLPGGGIGAAGGNGASGLVVVEY